MTLDALKTQLHAEPTTLVLVGPSGAGKTTIAEKLTDTNDQVVSTDALRARLAGDPSAIEANGVAKQILTQIVDYRASHDRTTVVDTTALQAPWRRTLAHAAAESRLWALIVEASLEACLTRQKDRDPQVPEEAVRRQHDKFGALKFAPGRFERLWCYRSEPGDLVEVA